MVRAMSEIELTADRVFDEIRQLLQPYNPNSIDIGMETDLTSDLNVDSVAAMTLVMEIEEKFDLDIPINLLPEMNSPRDLVDVVLAQAKS